MIELDLYTHKVPINISDSIAEKFKFPIVFYLCHKNDGRFFLVTFVILDFKNKELFYIFSYSSENLEKISKHKFSNFFRCKESQNAHCSINLTSGKDFWVFFEASHFFFHVDRQRNKLKIFTSSDLEIGEKNKAAEFGSTFYKDDSDNKYFYFTVLTEEHQAKEKLLSFFKASLDLSSLEKVFSIWQHPRHTAPHVTKKYKNYLLNSEFTWTEFKLRDSGEVLEAATPFMRYVYKDLYREFCKERNREFNEDEYNRKNNVSRVGGIHLESEFKIFCENKGKNFLDICQKNKKYNFDPLPGKISLIDIKRQTIEFYETTFCAPAHFEIDAKKDIIYTSSHNFTFFDNLYFLGPAAIDKFILEKNKLRKIGSFCDKEAYRFTTHKVFYYKDKSYICSFGQPNRLYFIDADTMKILYYDDIGEDYLSGKNDLCSYLNNNGYIYDKSIIRAIEISEDGEILFLLGKEFIYFYSFPDKKILEKFPYTSDIMVKKDIRLSDFHLRTTHSNYLY